MPSASSCAASGDACVARGERARELPRSIGPHGTLARHARSAAPAALALTGLWTAALAQSGVSTSESFVAVAQAVVSAGGSASSASYRAEQGIGELATGYEAASGFYRTLGGIPWCLPTAGNPAQAPILTHVQPASGSYAGGESVSLLGAHFLAAGAGAPQVLFGNQPATSVAVLSGNRIAATTPIGQDAFTLNPLGPTHVRVLNAHGQALLPNAFAYSPSLAVLPGSPSATAPFLLSAHIGGPSLFLIYAGQSFPGVRLPVAGFVGSTCIFSPLVPIVALAFLPSGQFEQVYELGAPELIGQSLTLQGAAIHSFAPLSGVMTNPLSLTFQP